MTIENIEAYGRNGYFWLKSFELNWRWGPAVEAGEKVGIVNFFSKIRTRRGRDTSPPIQFIGDRKDLIKLFKGVVKELEKL